MTEETATVGTAEVGAEDAPTVETPYDDSKDAVLEPSDEVLDLIERGATQTVEA